MSDSVWPHRRQPTRLSHPWDSLGKNTGVDCHFLLQCMKVKSENEGPQWCLTLRDLMDCSLPGSSIHGIFQARVLEWGAIAFSKASIWVIIYSNPPEDTHTKINTEWSYQWNIGFLMCQTWTNSKFTKSCLNWHLNSLISKRILGYCPAHPGGCLDHKLVL